MHDSNTQGSRGTTLKSGQKYFQCRSSKNVTHSELSIDDKASDSLQPCVDQYAESFLHRSCLNAYGADSVRVDFEPTAPYMMEVYKFRAKNASTRDKVASYNEATQFWDASKFLRSNHGPDKPSVKSREGRKLQVAEYLKRMEPKL